MVLSDPRESRLPDIGLITLEDAETAQVVEIDTGNPRMRKGYQTAAKKRNKQLAACLRSKGLDWVETSTDAPYMPALQQLFARRAKRYKDANRTTRATPGSKTGKPARPDRSNGKHILADCPRRVLPVGNGGEFSSAGFPLGVNEADDYK